MKLKTTRILMLILACLMLVFLILWLCFEQEGFKYLSIVFLFMGAAVWFAFGRCPHCGRYLRRAFDHDCPRCGEKLE